MAEHSADSGHIYGRFDDDLQAMAARVREMGELAAGQVNKAAAALATDPAAARPVIGRERRLNDLDMDVQERLFNVLARHQPVARDLRFVVALGRIANELERVGDEAKKIAKVAEQEYEHLPLGNDLAVFGDVPHLAELSTEQLDSAMIAVGKSDVDLAVRVIKRDQVLDQRFSASLRHLATYMLEDSRKIGAAINATLVLKSLERVGDHAASICHHLIFAIYSKDVRYIQAEHLGNGYLDE